jgi:hypothetical protein
MFVEGIGKHNACWAGVRIVDACHEGWMNRMYEVFAEYSKYWDSRLPTASLHGRKSGEIRSNG